MWLEKGIALLDGGPLKEAEMCFKEELKINPYNFDALNFLALSLIKQGQHKDAIRPLLTACSIDSHNSQTLNNLGICYAKTKQYSSAINTFAQLLPMHPNNPLLLNSIGNSYRLINDIKNSEVFLKKAINLAPNHPQIMQNLGWLFLQKKDYVKAEDLFNKLTSLYPQDLSNYLGSAEALFNQGEIDKALSLLKQVIKIKSSSSSCLVKIAKLATKYNQTELSIDTYELALKSNPNDPDANLYLACLLHQIGSNERTSDLLLQALEIKPLEFYAYFELTYFSKYIPEKEDLGKWEHLYDKHELVENCYWLGFSIAKVYERLGQFRESSIYYTRARKVLAQFKSASIGALNQVLTFSKKNQKTKTNLLKASNKQLILITGLPRSGTTLHQQILGAHTSVESIGESGVIALLASKVESITKTPFYYGLSQLTQANIADLSGWLTEWLEQFEGKVILDTSPANRFYLALISSLLPTSYIVYCVRSPLDTALSLFQHPLTGANAFANEFSSLSDHIELCEQHLDFWQSENQNLIVSYYENLVSSPKIKIDNLLKRLNLINDTECFEPEKQLSRVKTPSCIDVRQPISTNTIGRWTNYAEYFTELVDALYPLEQQYHKRRKKFAKRFE